MTLLNSEQSSYKARRKGLAEPSTLDLLLEFRAKTPNLGETLLVGDLNARTADKNTTPEELSDEHGPEVNYPISFPESDERISKLVRTKFTTQGERFFWTS